MRIEWDMPNHAGRGTMKQKRPDCLWISPGFPAEGRAATQRRQPGLTGY
jgi:hypothetical protein